MSRAPARSEKATTTTMQTLESLRQFFDYNAWSNRRVIETLKAQSSPSLKALRALAHLLIAEQEWLLRLSGRDSTDYNFWPEMNLDNCVKLAEENALGYSELLAGLDEEGLERRATYHNSKGIEYSNSWREMLSHVLLHSTYHRGQVAMASRAAEMPPAYTDYILYLREAK